MYNVGKLEKSSKKRRAEEGELVDRLSSLRDAIIIDIISLLSIETAAATSALSKRWVHLWTHVTSLHFRCLELPTVCHILGQLVSPKINQLQLEPGNKGIEAVFSIVDSCCDHIRGRNVERIEVILDTHYMWFHMPSWVFKCETLVALKLVGTLIKDDTVFLANINLPNLKELSLSLNDDNRNLMKTLFRSCPSLEDLILTCHLLKAGHLVDISSPNLKSLCIWMTGPSKREMIINAPMLSQITMTNFYTTSCHFVHIPTLLMKADLNFHNFYYYYEYNYKGYYEDDDFIISLLSKLVLGISSVRYVTLYNASKVFNYLSSLDDGACPIFHNLTHLEARLINCWKDLFYSLRCFPNVGVLRVSIDPKKQDDWDEYESLSTDLLSKVKWMEIIGMGYDSDMKALEYILSNAGVMEHLAVHIYVDDKEREASLCKERKFFETLFKLPRSSPCCEIEFRGFMVTASSNDIKN